MLQQYADLRMVTALRVYCDVERPRCRCGLTPPTRDPIVVTEWSSFLPRPTMRRLAATILASAVLAGGVAAGSGVATAAPSGGSSALAAGSSDFVIPDPIADVLSGVAICAGGILTGHNCLDNGTGIG
ncbi:hypothetical protein [Rhodococcus sp. NPDC127528]|uniref:hypothetical protein n=1 Tax=unclassified Rhodococcus (in: high G+C Gram-positive bacteria) TaxID=192944 RepID=UPI00363F4573